MSIVVSGLTKRFATAGPPAVASVAFAAPSGRVTALVGPSGAGKSTVLRIIAGLEQPDEGSVELDGVDCTAAPVQKRGVGFVFQSFALFKHMTVAENVAFGLRIRRLSRREVARRVGELVTLVQLVGLATRYPAQLSGGQRQRVALARALAIQPRVLLLDEPFGSLDAPLRRELRAWLRCLHEQTRITTLLVTHDLEEAMELAHHMVVMHKGRVAQTGTPQDIFAAPATPFVASFVGARSILAGGDALGRAAAGAFGAAAPRAARDGATVQSFVLREDVRFAGPS